MRSKRAREAGWALVFLAPSLLGLSVFVLVPALGTARYAFADAAGRFVWLRNFIGALGNDAFRLAAGNTARFLAVCVPLLLAASLALAQGLSTLTSKSAKLRACFLLPMVVPVSSIAFVWQYFFSERGLLSAALQVLGMTGQNWLNSPAAFWVLVVTYLWRNVGYDMVLFLAALSALPVQVYEAARIDGAGGITLWWHITLPQLMPTVATVAVLSLLNAFKVYREIYLLAGSYPHESIYMLQHLFANWFSKLEMEKLSAAALMTALALCAPVALFGRLLGRERTE